MVKLLSQPLWEQERPLCGNTTWTGTKMSLGPMRRRPGLFERSTGRHHESINMLLDCGKTLTLPTCRHLFLMSLSCMRETKHNLQTQETFHIIHCASLLVTSNLEAFMHVNRHKFKRLSFNLDDPSFKLYVDTTKDGDEQWRG